MYTQLYLKWVTYKDLLNSTGNSAQYYITTKMGKEFEKEYIHACVKKKKKKNQNLNLKKKTKKQRLLLCLVPAKEIDILTIPFHCHPKESILYLYTHECVCFARHKVHEFLS